MVAFVISFTFLSQSLVAWGDGIRFPFNDGKTYGIDVSHYDGHIDWDRVAAAEVKFVYIKATQGLSFHDVKFVENIKGARAAELPVGAYHFLSAAGSAEGQAADFNMSYGRFHQAHDLAPALDLEWDPERHTGADRWSNESPRHIVDKVASWLELVEQKFGVQPIIYTNESWWNGRIGDEGKRLRKYKIWISNYSRNSHESPHMMEDFQWSIWQFTAKGKVDGIQGHIDVNFLHSDSGLPEPVAVPDAPQVAVARPECKVPAAPAAQTALTSAELAKVFDTVRGQFGELSDADVNFFNVLINGSSPRQLRALIGNKTQMALTSGETKQFFNNARSSVGGGSLTSEQVDLLNQLLVSADPDLVRNCIGE